MLCQEPENPKDETEIAVDDVDMEVTNYRCRIISGTFHYSKALAIFPQFFLSVLSFPLNYGALSLNINNSKMLKIIIKTTPHRDSSIISSLICISTFFFQHSRKIQPGINRIGNGKHTAYFNKEIFRVLRILGHPPAYKGIRPDDDDNPIQISRKNKMSSKCSHYQSSKYRQFWTTIQSKLFEFTFNGILKSYIMLLIWLFMYSWMQCGKCSNVTFLAHLMFTHFSIPL